MGGPVIGSRLPRQETVYEVVDDRDWLLPNVHTQKEGPCLMEYRVGKSSESEKRGYKTFTTFSKKEQIQPFRQ